MSHQYLIYLAGPISGLTYEGATDWREQAKRKLAKLSFGSIRTLNPMRHAEFLKEVSSLEQTYEGDLMTSQRGIFYRDKMDTLRADMVIVNLLGAERVSIGTVMEIAMANVGQVPVLLVMEPEGNIHDHCMLREASAFRVGSLEEAYLRAAQILLPDDQMNTQVTL